MKNWTFFLIIIFFLFCFPVWAGVSYDGTDDFLNCGDTADFDNLTSFSWSFWIKIGTLEQGGRIIHKWDNDVADGRQILITLSSVNGDEILGGVRDLAGNFSLWVTDAADLSTGVWYHITVTWTADNTWVFYVDGNVEPSSVVSDSGSGVDTATGVNPLSITKDPLGQATGNYIDAEITEVAGWAAIVLTAPEVIQLATSKVKRIPLQIRPASLKIYIPLDDEPDGTSADGDVFLDMSGNGNNCTGDNGANNTGLTALAETVLTIAP